MALLVQRVSGAYHGNLFFPACAGVGISYNTFVWRHDIDPTAGMLRLVVGLGTRAVDRVEGDYPRVVSLDQPLLVPDADPENRRRFTQHDVDVLDIAQNSWRTIPLSELQAEEPTLPLDLLADRDDCRLARDLRPSADQDRFRRHHAPAAAPRSSAPTTTRSTSNSPAPSRATAAST